MTTPKTPSTEADVVREAETTRAAVERTLNQAERTARAAAKGSEEIIVTAARERPIAAVAAALALGFLFGRAL